MKYLVILIITAGFFAGSCKNKSTANGNTSVNTDTKNDNKSLLNNPGKPGGISFKRMEIENASFELPVGNEWTQEDNFFIQESLNMIIKIQTQKDDMRDMKEPYLESYNENNIRDAQNWKRGSTEFGEINGVQSAKLSGNFNNGTAFIVRDFVFFDKDKVVILQTRVAEKNSDKLNAVADYIASTYK